MGLAQLGICVLVNFAFASCGWRCGFRREGIGGYRCSWKNGLWTPIRSSCTPGLCPESGASNRYRAQSILNCLPILRAQGQHADQRNQEEPRAFTLSVDRRGPHCALQHKQASGSVLSKRLCMQRKGAEDYRSFGARVLSGHGATLAVACAP